MNVRIQTYSTSFYREWLVSSSNSVYYNIWPFSIGPYTPRQALAKGLDDLVALCDVVTEKFVEARENVMNDGASPEAQEAAKWKGG